MSDLEVQIVELYHQLTAEQRQLMILSAALTACAAVPEAAPASQDSCS